MNVAGTIDLVDFTAIDVGVVQMRLLEAGPHQASEAVVFVHGNPGSVGDWKGLVTEAGKSHRAVAVELPDFGQTIAPPGFEHTVDEYVDFLGEALDTLGIRRIQFVLHDLGALIALPWTLANPGRVASVTLIDTGLLPGYKWHPAARIWQAPGLGEIAQGVLTRGIFRRTAGNAEPRGLPREFLDEMYDNYDRRTRKAVLDLYRDIKTIGTDSRLMIEPLARLDLPCLVVWGEQDPYLSPDYAEIQRQAFPSAYVHTLANTGHWPFIDDPSTVTPLVTEFLDSVQ